MEKRIFDPSITIDSVDGQYVEVKHRKYCAPKILNMAAGK
jgi:hypothetical protein